MQPQLCCLFQTAPPPPTPTLPPPFISLQGSPLCGRLLLALAVVIRLESVMLYFLFSIASHIFCRSRAMPSLNIGQMSLDTDVMGT